MEIENKNKRSNIPNRSMPTTEKGNNGIDGMNVSKNKESGGRIFKIVAVVLVIVVAVFLVRKLIFNPRSGIKSGPTSYDISTSMGAEWGFFDIVTEGGPLDNLILNKWSRITGMVWPKLQDLNGQYNWELMDEYVKKAQANGYNLVFVIKTGNNRIISEENCFRAVEKSDDNERYLHSCPIKSEYEDDWKDLIYNIVERYDSDGKNDMPGLKNSFVLDIQIENEAGNPYYWYFNETKDGKNAADKYLKILKLAYEAKEEADPSTKIIIPGIIHAHRLARCANGTLDSAVCSADFEKRNEGFTKELLKHPEYFDAVDIHEFIYFKFDPYYVKDGLSWLKSEMQKNGYAKPIHSLEWTGSIMLRVKTEGFIKEFSGYFPYSNEFSNIEDFFFAYQDLAAPENKKYRDWFESEQAKEFTKLFTTMLVGGVERLVHVQFHDYVGTGWDNVWWNWQGIVRYEGTRENPILIKKPSYYTYNIVADKIAGFTAVKELDFGMNTFIYEFNFKNRDSVYIAWTEGTTKNIDLSKYIASKNIKITHVVMELDGSNNPIYKDDETSSADSILITDIPILIEEGLVSDLL